jgi:hypothetical protein
MSAGFRRKRRRARRAGTASVEIVVMLPLFIVLFAAVYHLHATGSAALLAAEQSRACAWQFAVSGCEDASKVELCKGVLASKGADVKGESDARVQGGDEAGAELDRSKSMLDKIEDIPVLGGLVRMLFGEGAVASARADAPRFMKAETVPLEKSYYIVCNTVSKSWGDLIKDQVCAVVTGKLGMEGKVLGCK